jgi:hypothetical protein
MPCNRLLSLHIKTVSIHAVLEIEKCSGQIADLSCTPKTDPAVAASLPASSKWRKDAHCFGSSSCCRCCKMQLLPPPTPSFSGNTVAFPISTVGLLSSSPPPSPITSLPPSPRAASPTAAGPGGGGDLRPRRWRAPTAASSPCGGGDPRRPWARRRSSTAGLPCQLADPGCPAAELPRSGASGGGAPSIRSKRRRSYTTGHSDVDFRGVDGGGAGGVDGSGGVGEVRTATTKMEARTLLELFPRDDASYPDGGCELRRPSRGRARWPPPSLPAASSSMLAGCLLLHARRPPPSSPAASSSMRVGSLLHPRERRCPQSYRWWLPSALPSRRNPRCRGRQRPELDAQREPAAWRHLGP